MDYIIIGGDARMAFLAAALRDAGFSARHVCCGEDGRALMDAPELIRGAKRVVSNYPPRPRGLSLSTEALLALAGSDARVYFCGPASPDIDDERIVDLSADEAFLRENAMLTAEGAMAAAMQAGRRCLRGARCVVIGWGRIGAALTELLVALGARVTVASRDEAHRRRAIERGAESVDTSEMDAALATADVVFSTPPAMVLDDERLERVNPRALLIDLASPPYGVDLHAAWERGLRAWREPGLPGRYCPESAADALMSVLLRAEREVIEND